jgi:putative oxidoreductase
MNKFTFIPLLGRILIGAPFLMSGLSKLGAHDNTVGYIASAGLPAAALAFFIAVAVEAGGGLLLIAGYRARLVSLVLAVFSLATAVFFHHNFEDQNQMIHFLKNVMMAGGLLQITYFGAGAWSLDARTTDAASDISALRTKRV